MRFALVTLQAATFVGLGVLLLHQGRVRLGLAQLGLCVVTALVYS